MHTAVKIGLGVGALVIAGRLLQLNKLAANVSVSLSKVRVHKVGHYHLIEHQITFFIDHL